MNHIARQVPDVAAERGHEECRDHDCEEQSHDDDSPTRSSAAPIRRLARHAGRSRTGSERAGIWDVPPEHNQDNKAPTSSTSARRSESLHLGHTCRQYRRSPRQRRRQGHDAGTDAEAAVVVDAGDHLHGPGDVSVHSTEGGWKDLEGPLSGVKCHSGTGVSVAQVPEERSQNRS